MASDTPLYFRVLARFLRPFPDFDFGFIKPVRERAVAALQLGEGDRALDLGCGPGGSLPYLRTAVGARGEVVGVEISPTVAALASRRIAEHGWTNVRVVVSPAERAELPNGCDGALMFAAPDVYGSSAAWTNLRRVLRPGARVAFFGAKTSSRRGGWLLNGVFRAAMPRLSFASTPLPTDAPWALVAPELADLEVHEYFGGWMFLATGTWAPTVQEPELISVLTCPSCGHASRCAMPTDACQFFHECAECHAMMRPKPGDCCVFCSFGSVRCPPMQEGGGGCCGSGRSEDLG